MLRISFFLILGWALLIMLSAGLVADAAADGAAAVAVELDSIAVL